MVLTLHLAVIAIAIFFAYIGTKKDYNKTRKISYGVLASFLILFVFLGFRVNLGRDWINYQRIFDAVNQQHFLFGKSREYGFLFLVSFLKEMELDFQAFIIVSSLLMLLLFFLAFRKYVFLLPFAIFVFFMDWGYPVVINTIRQGIALMAFLNAISYIDNREENANRKFCFFLCIGVLFHYSILLMLPFYYIAKIKLDFFNFLILLFFVFALSFLVIIPLYENTMILMEKYQSYRGASYIYNESTSFGLGATLVLLIRLAPLSIYDYVRREKPEMLKYYVLYFIGLSVYYGFYKFLLITRITFYFQFIGLFVIAFFLYFVFQIKKKYRLLGIGYVSVILFNYIYTFNDFLIDQVRSATFSIMFMDFRLH